MTSRNIYDNPNDLKITTIDDVIYAGVKNDVSVLIDGTMMLMEHQTTINPNMPLRGFFYFADLYRAVIQDSLASLVRWIRSAKG